MTTVGEYSFEARIASCGYHVYKETWSKARDGENIKVDLDTRQSSRKVDPYACAICAKEEYFKGWKTAGYIQRKISRKLFISSKQLMALSMGQ